MSKIAKLSKCLVEKYSIDQGDANRFVREMFDTIKDNLERDKLVKVRGLGTFKIVETSARESIDVNTKERIVIEAKNKISFTPENAVRDRVNSPFSQFDAIEIGQDVEFDEKVETEPTKVEAPEPEKEPESELEEEEVAKGGRHLRVMIVVAAIIIGFIVGYCVGRGLITK